MVTGISIWSSVDPRQRRLSVMEKFTKFRDPGTGIAPFLPIAPGSRTPLVLPFELTLCVLRIPLIFLVLGSEIVLVEGVGELCLRRALPSLLGWIRWLFLRTILFLCGIWWIDEQPDGVSKSQRKLAIAPQRGNVIASNHTGPLDLIYLAAKYDVIFVSCFVSTDKVQQTAFPTALWRSVNSPLLEPPSNAVLLSIQDLSDKLPDRVIAVFPETTPTNGRALLTFSPGTPRTLSSSLLTYACNIKYTPLDITLPTPSLWTFLWHSTSFVKHSMRVRITHRPVTRGADLHEAICRIGRLKSVGLGAKEKTEFLEAWKKKR